MITEEDLGINGYKIYQQDGLYKFTSDAVRLSEFARVKKGDRLADLCSGCGIVGLHTYALNAGMIDSVTLFEMQTPLHALANKTIEKNALSDSFTAVNCRVQDIPTSYNGKFSIVVCNPPYMPKDSGEVRINPSSAAARTETFLPLDQLLLATSRVLKFGGRACIVHRAERLTDLLCGMRAVGIEPKRLQLVRAGKKSAYAVMVEGVKGGKSGLKIEKDALNGAEE